MDASRLLRRAGLNTVNVIAIGFGANGHASYTAANANIMINVTSVS